MKYEGTKSEAIKLAQEFGSKAVTAIELKLNRNPYNDAETAAHFGRIALKMKE